MPGVPPHLTPHLLPRSAAVRLCLLAALAAGLSYVAWFWRPLPADLDAGKARGEDPQLQVRAPTLDPELLAQVRDDSRSARLQLEAAPLQHLLERALDVGPAAAQALGMPEQPVPLTVLRAHAANWRGHWLGYRGRIVDLSGPRPGHPNASYGIYEATLQLDDRRPLRPELLDQIVGRHARLEHFAAGEDVDRRVPVLWPGVNGQVRFGDDDDATDAERVELVEDHVDDGGLGPLCRFD